MDRAIPFFHLASTAILSAVLFYTVACGDGVTPSYEDIQEVPLPSEHRTSTEQEKTEESVEEEKASPTDSNASLDEDPVYYYFSDEDSLLYAQVWKDEGTILSWMAHDHVLRAANWTGSIVYHPEDLSLCSISFVLPVDDLRNDEPIMREFVGLEGEISETDREKIRENMLADDQLNAAEFLTIEFVSTVCSGAGGESGQIEVIGTITIRGVSKTLGITVYFERLNDKLYAKGEFNFQHSDFNFSPYSAFAGAIKNAQTIKMAFDVIGNSN